MPVRRRRDSVPVCGLGRACALDAATPTETASSAILKARDANIPESEVKAGCMELLGRLGYLVVRVQSGHVRVKGGGYMYLAEPGTADILACSPTGLFVAVECKRPVGGRKTQEQEDFRARVQMRGGVYVRVRSAAELASELQQSGPPGA